jgi:hypothetical protein
MNIKMFFFYEIVVRTIHISLNKPSKCIYLMKDLPSSNYSVDFCSLPVQYSG